MVLFLLKKSGGIEDRVAQVGVDRERRRTQLLTCARVDTSSLERERGCQGCSGGGGGC